MNGRQRRKQTKWAIFDENIKDLFGQTWFDDVKSKQVQVYGISGMNVAVIASVMKIQDGIPVKIDVVQTAPLRDGSIPKNISDLGYVCKYSDPSNPEILSEEDAYVCAVCGDTVCYNHCRFVGTRGLKIAVCMEHYPVAIRRFWLRFMLATCVNAFMEILNNFTGGSMKDRYSGFFIPDPLNAVRKPTWLERIIGFIKSRRKPKGKAGGVMRA